MEVPATSMRSPRRPTGAPPLDVISRLADIAGTAEWPSGSTRLAAGESRS
jgi:hypothetical protein